MKHFILSFLLALTFAAAGIGLGMMAFMHTQSINITEGK